ncbi:LysM peptidoglycan-binding domain-containing protein [Candidatus Saccharibacteria bacterium]|nr:MAG: LysM peptidoglycan-binding domain-containing protein [Candidatus Saccharibacteria bacterium]
MSANIIILAAVIGFVFLTSHDDNKAAVLHAVSSASADTATNPVDRLTSYDIAANVARVTNLPEQKPITNQAQSAKVSLAVSTSSETTVVAKPQIPTTALKNKRDIKTYTVQAGEDVAAIAQKFGVTSDSIKWSNNLNTNTVNAGTKLSIPPVNGIVYTVASGDTVQSLASKYKANVDQIVAYNDAEIAGLKVGEKIIIPGGQVQQPVVSATSLYSRLGSFTATYGGNGYDFGYCTWYVATQVAVPTNWGNASTWAYYAALSGWTVSSTPKVGAIAQTSRGYEGHVAMVQDVSPDGSQVLIRDMNGIAGWGRVGVGWQATAKYEHFIYH